MNKLLEFERKKTNFNIEIKPTFTNLKVEKNPTCNLKKFRAHL
jgi:hypothetical protein